MLMSVFETERERCSVCGEELRPDGSCFECEKKQSSFNMRHTCEDCGEELRANIGEMGICSECSKKRFLGF